MSKYKIPVLMPLLMVLGLVLLDQLSKMAILFWFELAAEYQNGLPIVQPFNKKIELTSFFNLVLVWNHGVSFGMFNNANAADNELQRWLLVGLNVAVSGLLLHWLRRTQILWQALAYSFIISGAIGNAIDRLLFGAVVDFLDFHLAGQHWPAFNVADSCIFIGVLMLVSEGFFVKHKAHENVKK